MSTRTTEQRLFRAPFLHQGGIFSGVVGGATRPLCVRLCGDPVDDAQLCFGGEITEATNAFLLFPLKVLAAGGQPFHLDVHRTRHLHQRGRSRFQVAIWCTRAKDFSFKERLWLGIIDFPSLSQQPPLSFSLPSINLHERKAVPLRLTRGHQCPLSYEFL